VKEEQATRAADASAEPRGRESPRETFAYWGYAGASRLARTLPRRAGEVLFRLAGRIAFRMLGSRRAVVADNQARVLGLEPNDPLVTLAAREAFDRYARYWLDSFRAPMMSDEEVLRRFVLEGREHLDEALASTGCLVALPHMGNWDVAGRWLDAKGYPVVSVAERLRPPRLFDLFLRHREALGMQIVALSPGSRVGRRLTSLLGERAVVALVADRDLTGRGIEVEMFGAPRRLPAGPAALAISAGTGLLVAGITSTDDGWRCVIEPPIDFAPTGDRRADVRELTRLMAAAFERRISAGPADWHLFQPGWDR
jgi:phosphatidylinositol dimannoside acyltransferase